MSIFKKLKEKVVNHFLARFVDKFKAKNPKIFFLLQAGLTTVTVTAGAVTALAERWINELPYLTEMFPWLYDVETWMALTVTASSYVLQILAGSSTPGTTKAVRFLTDHQDGKILYLEGQRYFLPPKLADQFIEDDIAIELIITKPKKLPAHENKAA